MTARERVLACLAGGKPDEVPMRDAPLSWTLKRWEKEGMRPGGFPGDFFENCIDGTGLDIKDKNSALEILEDDGRSRITRSPDGTITRSFPCSNSTPHVLEYGIKNRTDWERFTATREPPIDASLLDKKALAWMKDIGEQKQTWCCQCVTGLFYSTCIVGMENALTLMIENPDWIKTMADHAAERIIQNIEIVKRQGVRLDGIYYDDDMAFKNGPMFSPALFKKLFKPGMMHIFNYVHGWGGHVFMHTDGFINPLLPDLIEAGIDIIDPMEVKAGVDLAELKEKFGRKIVWEGNIDAMKLYYGTKADIEEEVCRKLSLFPDGGYIYRLDGPISEEASYDNYRWLIDCVHRYGKY